MDYGNLKVPENVTPEVQAILDSYEARNKEIENAHRKEMAKQYGGAVLQIGSALIPGTLGLKAAGGAIKALTPYVATGLGGGLYELGQGIMEGDKAPELLKKTGIGAGIGAGVGAVAGKALPAFAKSKAGQAIGNQASKLYNSFADTKIGQKVSEIAPKVEDLLMTDIKAFNPFKQTQTVYHGSPADFNKFSNEAIGTGEGAQAHGYGHYAAKNKDVAEGYRRNLSKKDTPYEEYKTLTQYIDFLNGLKEKAGLSEGLENALQKSKTELSNLMNTYKPEEYLNNVNNGQLYKLSIPKDDVMLREDLGIWEQPQKVQDAILKLSKELNEKYPGNRFVKDFDNIIFNGNGKDLYKTLWHHNTAEQGELLNINEELNAWKLSAQDLSKHGIKGISYNGGIDGEANVIFNPDDIEIVRKYYNQPSLYELIKKQKPFYGGVSNALYDYITGE
jgi:hypothetical protein